MKQFFYSAEDLKINLHSADILTYNKYSESELFIVSANRLGANKQVMKIKVKYGPFILKVSAIIVLEQSKFHLIKPMYQQNTSIYPLNKKTIVKCFPYKPEHFESLFLHVLRQVCLLKIGSAIQAGPGINNQCYFDLVIYQTCV